jgi:hypothetical protein
MNFILTQSKHQPVQDDQNRMDTETEEDADDSQDQVIDEETLTNDVDKLISSGTPFKFF